MSLINTLILINILYVLAPRFSLQLYVISRQTNTKCRWLIYIYKKSTLCRRERQHFNYSLVTAQHSLFGLRKKILYKVDRRKSIRREGGREEKLCTDLYSDEDDIRSIRLYVIICLERKFSSEFGKCGRVKSILSIIQPIQQMHFRYWQCNVMF